MAIAGLGILIEMVCCRWGDHRGGVLVNLRRQHGGGGDLGDAAAVSLPVRLVSKQMPIRHTDLGRMLVVIWSLHSKTPPQLPQSAAPSKILRGHLRTSSSLEPWEKPRQSGSPMLDYSVPLHLNETQLEH